MHSLLPMINISLFSQNFFYTSTHPVSSHNRNETNKWMEHRQTSLIPNKLMIQKAIIMFFPCITFNNFHCNLRQNSSQQHLNYPVFYLPSNFENFEKLFFCHPYNSTNRIFRCSLSSQVLLFTSFPLLPSIQNMPFPTYSFTDIHIVIPHHIFLQKFLFVNPEKSLVVFKTSLIVSGSLGIGSNEANNILLFTKICLTVYPTPGSLKFQLYFLEERAQEVTS